MRIYHPEGSVFTHTMMMLDVLSKEERTLELFWGILYHDTGKKETFPKFSGHCEKSQEIFYREIIKFTESRELIDSVRRLVRYHEEPLRNALKGWGRQDIGEEAGCKGGYRQVIKTL